MLRTRQIRRCDANGHRARRSGAPCSSTAARVPSLHPRPQCVSRQLQLPCSEPLTTSVAKNAFRDRTRRTTEAPRDRIRSALACVLLSRQSVFQRNAQVVPRQRFPANQRHSVARTSIRDRIRQATEFTWNPHSASRTASSTSAVRGIPCCARACSVTWTAFSVGSSGA